MKNAIRVTIIAALAFFSISIFDFTSVRAANGAVFTVHTLKNTNLYAKGQSIDNGLGDPKFNFTPVTNRQLAANTDWYTDITADSNDSSYTRVATNEWVKWSDIVITNKADTPYPVTTEKSYPIFKFDPESYTMEKTSSVLPAGKWLVASFMTFPDGTPSYNQVATNEWVEMN